MLSERQQQTYRFIRGYITRHGHAPLLQEIATGLGIHSKGVVHRYVQALEEAGLIALRPGRHRGILLCDSGTVNSLKRLQHHGDGSLTLHPANATMAPLRYSAVRVATQGRLVGQMRRYR